MTLEEKDVWNRILRFEIDDPDSSFTFTNRLCRENDWTMQYALRAVLEYKRFMFLVCVSNEPQTPSDQVDQVWHLHLLYTQSYWKEFCGEVLKREVHHGPTKGAEQKEMFKDIYTATLALYKEKFDQQPPADIWPSPAKRMASINFTRVNRHTNWIIPKLKFRK
jgi:hypothetical protein